jgi:hypothetical protein
MVNWFDIYAASVRARHFNHAARPAPPNKRAILIDLFTDELLYVNDQMQWVLPKPRPHDHDAADTTTGTFTLARIPAIPVASVVGLGALAELNSVSAAYIDTDAVTNSKIQAGAVTISKIQDSAVNSDKLATDAVIASKIAANAVTNSKINNDAVTNDKIADNAVDTPQIVDEAVTNDKIAESTIELDRLADGTPNYLVGFDGTGAPTEVDPTTISGDMVLLASFAPGSNQASWTWTPTGVALTFDTILIKYSISTSYTANFDVLRMQLDGDTINHYSYSTYWSPGIAIGGIDSSSNGAFASLGFVRNVAGTAYGRWLVGECTIHNCLSDTLPKTYMSWNNYLDSTISYQNLPHTAAGAFVGLEELTNFMLYWVNGNILAGSKVQIFGLKS